MNPAKTSRSDQRGMALVMALIVLSAISLISMALLMSVTTEQKLSGHHLRENSALDFAEAGIAEATSRIALGDINFGNNPRGTAVIFNAAPGNLPAVGADTTALATAQPAGSWLRYSTATKNTDMLTVRYKTDAARTVIYRYDNTKNPPVNTLTGTPVYQVRSTGKRGMETRTVVTDVAQTPMLLNIKGALTAGVAVKFIGTANVCGYNHRADTPNDTGDDGRLVGTAPCYVDPTRWETGAGDMAGIWCTANVQTSGAANRAGNPPQLEFQTGFYAGPWEALGMTQAQFWAWIGPARSTLPNDANGVMYIDNNTVTQDGSGSYAVGGLNGSGFLYVDGSLTLNSDCYYRGMIYVEGNVTFNGNSWVLGSLIAKGDNEVKNNGMATILFSYDSIQTNIAKYKGQFMTLGWRELPSSSTGW